MIINILSINVYQNLNFSRQNNKIKVETDGTQQDYTKPVRQAEEQVPDKKQEYAFTVSGA